MGIIANNVEYIIKGIIIGTLHPKTIAILLPLVVKEEDG